MAGLDFFKHGGNIYSAGGLSDKSVTDYSANLNPLGLPAYIKKLIGSRIGDIVHYPDPEAGELVKQIAGYWGIGHENILVGNGSAELIYLVVSALKPKRALLTAPDFSEYERSLAAAGIRPGFLKLREADGFKLDTNRVRPSDLFFFSNPHNPTGNFLVGEGENLEKLPCGKVIVDEAFMDFAYDDKKRSMIRRAANSARIIVLRSFTKFFALAGLRAGYIVAHKESIRRLKAHQAPWGMNVLAQAAAARMLKDSSYIARTRSLVKRQSNYLLGAIGRIEGLKAFPCEANFILIKIERTGLSSGSLCRRLLKKGIMVRDCSNFRGMGDRFIRIAVRRREENLRLINAIEDILIR